MNLPVISDDSENQQGRFGEQMKKRRRFNTILALVISLFALLILAAGSLLWYQKNTSALDPNAEAMLFTVQEGDTADAIAARLHEEGFIRSELAFRIALRLDDRGTNIRAGQYRISPAENVQAILVTLESGDAGISTVTLIPGKTLMDIQQRLIEAGYPEASVERALAADYDHPLLAQKPADASLEGYIYPDTYEVDLSREPEVLIEKTFDVFYQKLEETEVLSAQERNGYTLHEIIILGSIVEREVNTAEDRPIVAQVFLKRLEMDMMLGSDATFVYAAQQLGVPPSTTLDSPYNTRVVTGLPPGPISNMTVDALEAVVNPADTDYLYFVTGDDNVTHYARTAQEHDENVENFCGVRCEL